MEDNSALKEDCFEIEIPFNLFQYLSTENCNIHNLCRICLSEKNKELFPLISSKDNGVLQDMFISFTDIQVYADDGLPSHICDLCRANVISCYEFRTQCLKSDCALKSLLKGEFVTKETETAKNNNETKVKSHVTEVPVEFEQIKKEAEFVEDVQYLEDISESDNEALCILQNKCKDEVVPVTGIDSQSPLKDGNPSKTKEKKHKSHTCSFCSKRFPNTKAMKMHVKRMHCSSKHAHACTQCKDSFESAFDLKLHLPLHEAGPVITCVQCNKEFKGRSKFRRHIQRHMQVKRYSCEACGKPFAELYALKRHVRVHTGERVEKRYQCHLCEKRYSESGLLAAHVARHTGVRPCVCTVCNKTFPSKRLLTSHRRVHLDHKPHACRYCDARFRHRSTLRTHERTHTGERPYVCATCGKSFIQNSNLTLHMRTHTGERPYSCVTCGRDFSSGSTLKTHIRTHTGDKPYQCPECGKKFARMDMRAHMRLHSGERPYACSACSRRFLTAPRLQEHKRVHTGERPFECAICSQKFATKTQLVKHMKSIHQTKRKGLVVFHQNGQPREYNIIANKLIDANEDVEIVESVANEDMEKAKEENVEATHDETTVSEEIIEIAKTETDIQSGTLCVTSGENPGINYRDNMNVVTMDESGICIASALESTMVKLYQVDQSLVQIHSAGGQVTISKITSKMTANF